MSAQDRTQLVLISVEVLISDANSLKAKRSALNKIKDRIKSLIKRIQNRFNASVAEVGDLDKWQRASLAISMVSNEKKKLQQETDKLEATLLSMTEISVNQFTKDWL